MTTTKSFLGIFKLSLEKALQSCVDSDLELINVATVVSDIYPIGEINESKYTIHIGVTVDSGKITSSNSILAKTLNNRYDVNARVQIRFLQPYSSKIDSNLPPNRNYIEPAKQLDTLEKFVKSMYHICIYDIAPDDDKKLIKIGETSAGNVQFSAVEKGYDITTSYVFIIDAIPDETLESYKFIYKI